MKITLVIEVYLDETWGDTDSEIQWLLDNVLDKETLSLHSNEVGDTVGKITDISVTHIKH